MERIIRDIRFAFRRLRKRPAFTLIAVFSLALGIGANTAIFSLVNAILLRRAPVQDAASLVEVYRRSSEFPYLPFSYPDYVELKDAEGDIFSAVAITQLTMIPRDLGDRIESLPIEMVNGAYFHVLSLTPALGRLLGPEDDVAPGAHAVVVLSYEYWKRSFAGDTKVIGSTLRLNGHSYTVVGVAPRAYTGNLRGVAPAIYAPIMMVNQLQPATEDQLKARGDNSLFLKARMHPGVSYAQARIRLQTFMKDMKKRYPADWPGNIEGVLIPSADVLVNPALDRVLVPAAALLMIVVGLVLLVACANLASFLLAQARDRQREIAIRLAIGASRAALVRQFLTETTVLALVGGTLGIGLARVLLNLLLHADLPLPIPITLDLGLDLPVLAFAITVSVISGLLFGLAPALNATRTSVIETIKNENTGGGAAKRVTARNALVVGQLAVSLVLLVVAGLFLRSLRARQVIDPGFGKAQAAVVTFVLPSEKATTERGRVLVHALMDRISQMPGVTSVGLISNLHLNALSTQNILVNVAGLQPPKGEVGYTTDYATADSAFFDAAGIAIVRGRPFKSTDIESAPRVAIINQAMADRFWPGQDPVGRTFTADSTPMQVVGVAKTVKIRSLAEDARPFVYRPWSQHYTTYMTLVARTRGDAAAIVPRVVEATHEVDRDIAIFEAKTMARHLAVIMLPARLAAIVISAFAMLALTLAIIGVYGVVSYAVARRSREVGIRMSLGADASSILRLLLGDSMRLIGVGAAIGLAVAVIATQTLRSLLFGVAPFDPITFLLVTGLLLGVGMIASWLPARRATRINPTALLRAE